MAVETEGARLGAGGGEAQKQGLSVLAARGRTLRTTAHALVGQAAELGRGLRSRVPLRLQPRALAGAITKALADPRALLQRLRLYIVSGPLVGFFTRTLQRRIILANTIGLAILLGGIFYLIQYHAWLIDAKRESLRAQGEIIAAAIAANASLETGRIVLDPDRLPEIEGSKSPFRDDGFAALQLSIAPERVTPMLKRLVPATDTRARVYAHDGTLIIDTAQLLRGQAGHAEPGSEYHGRVKVKNNWTKFLAWLMRGELPVYREIGSANGTAYPEVRMALSGSTTPMLLVNEKGEQIVSMAVPIQYRKAVQGVLLLSTRPGEIDEVLSEERNVIIALALTAFAATLLASFLLARTIAGPMRRLSEVAENVSRNIKARDELPELAHRADEVGQMATAFREMTASLHRRIEASERFAQDVAHELKNPLTAARSTAEALAYAKSPEQQTELVEQIQGELKRLNKLITDVANASRLDAELALQETEPVDMREVLDGVANVFRDILGGEGRRIVLDIAPSLDPSAYVVRGLEERLSRVITNLLDNAISFSPANGVVRMSARRSGSEIEVVVQDEGPGIPANKLEDIFKRFYSDRPQTDRTVGKNSGLGLSISREIVNAYGGRIWATNRNGKASAAWPDAAGPRDPGATEVAGAAFVVRLPAADIPAAKGALPLARRH
ncbi:MAG TPA: stimulus-sensing domain-containing protein [Hyphomicrobiaceae bacterium]|nr:stimulus-sensing domain-containing protein [Hyphomicrobiaceae bacterium]